MPPIGNRNKPSLSEMLAKHLIWQSPDTLTAKIYHGHVIDVLNKMPSRSVQTVVTSPPYWALRDYGSDKTFEIGSEDTPEEYVATMVNVFRAVRRILRDDGTLWLNLGDTYGAGSNRNGVDSGTLLEGRKPNNPDLLRDKGLPPGNLVGIPWRVALALQADGWILRQDNIWSKTNPMPESVNNRCTKSHEYIFLLTKSEKYFYDGEAIKDNAKTISKAKGFIPHSEKDRKDSTGKTSAANASKNRDPDKVYTNSNKKSVWSIDDHKSLLEWLSVKDPELLARYLDEQTNKSDVWRLSSQPYKEAHFATFGRGLVEPCIKAGTSEHGCCSACGSPYERILSEPLGGHTGSSWRDHSRDAIERGRMRGGQKEYDTYVPSKTLGWRATCSCWVCSVCTKPWSHVCNCDGGEERFGKPPIRPCIVLDPFAGTFTTGEVAISLGRYAWGIELSEEYIRDLAIPRILSAVMQRMADLQWQRRNSQTQ